MNGLLEKDLRLLFQRKQAFFIFLSIAVILGFVQGGTFIIGYLPFLSIMLAVSTISYDEFDNGYPFLFTLPITRKSYVAEKYIFCLMVTFCTWILSILLNIGLTMIAGTPLDVIEMSFTSVVLLMMCVAMADIMIPVQIKYGSERSRMVLLAIIGIGAIAMYGLVKLGKTIGIDTITLSSRLSELPRGVLLLVLVIAILAVTLLSISITIKIMEKKEF